MGATANNLPSQTVPPAPSRDTAPRFSLHDVVSLSLGAWVILFLAVASSLAIAIWPIPRRSGLDMWIFSRNHGEFYTPEIARWNAAAAANHTPNINMYIISSDALMRRTMSGFLAHTPVADVMEVERSQIGQVFSGPLDDIGFVDLTERLRAEGIDKEMNEPSFGPWTSRGHIFGLPHDVHPVLLCYRADITDAAGIDMTQIETWDDFARILRPLVQDLDGDGRPDRYALNMWHTNMDCTELLILQAGGNFFDAQERPVMASDINAHVLATIVSWCEGPNRIAADAPEFSASGNELKNNGFVVCSFMPDWLGGVWKQDLGKLSGKLRLMPLPAWTKGGRRTSVWGGTMLGIPKTTRDFDTTWKFAKQIYLSPAVAQQLYKTTNIISPVKSLWSSAFYDVPAPYFSGQAPGRLYINQAPNVPRRTSSPFNMLAKQRVQDATIALREWAITHKNFDIAALEPQAQRLLEEAQALVQRQIDRNVFLKSAMLEGAR